MNQAINAPHIVNLRELGGYPCGDKHVVQGHFFRSAVLSGMTQEDIACLQAQGIRLIVDFRSDAEAAKEPDVVPAFCEYHRLSGITGTNTRNGDMDVKTFVQSTAERMDGGADLTDYLAGCYSAMARNGAAFRALFELILENPDKPLLFHCAAGKDRTGVAAALILRALGASEQTAMADYLQSNICRKSENDRILAQIHATDPAVRARMRTLLEVQPRSLESFFEQVTATYGSWPRYFAEQLGVSDAQRKQLQARYLR